jgi:hypothetical protein
MDLDRLTPLIKSATTLTLATELAITALVPEFKGSQCLRSWCSWGYYSWGTYYERKNRCS